MQFRDWSQQATIWLAWGLVMCAHLATELVLGGGVDDRWSIAMKFLGVAVLWGALLRGMLRRPRVVGGLAVLLSMAAMAGPLLVEPLWRMATGSGHAVEEQLLIGFRNLSLVTILWAGQPRLHRLSVLTSLFALLFCVSTSQERSLAIVCGVYLLLGICWLCTTYWSGLKTEQVIGQQQPAPWFLLVSVSLLLLGALALFAVPESLRTRMVAGFFPSSGGTGQHDPFARSGVGDGDALVAGTENALSFAPLEDAPFIEGSEPSLYDVFQDTYGKTKPPTQLQRAISLPPELFTPNHHRMAAAKKSAETFSLDREPPRKPGHRHVKDTASDAILHLVGRVPAHLRHTTYDLFDGTEWYPEAIRATHRRTLQVQELSEKPWIHWPPTVQQPFLSGPEPHALRVLNVNTNRVLAPVNLQGVHIDRCDRVDLFRWAQPDVLAMDRPSLPGMTVIRLQSRVVDESVLAAKQPALHGALPEYLAFPEGEGMAQIRELAREWTADCRTKWDKVVAIRERLRSIYQLDPGIVVPDDCPNPAAWFLTERKAGPDYLFATAAVLLCRAEGIGSRAVSGFYARPDRYEPTSRQTSVMPSDTHWWAEVALGGGIWQTVEATPGYTVLAPRGSLLGQIWLSLRSAGTTALHFWPLTLTICVLCGLAVYEHRRIQARLLTWKWIYRHKLRRHVPDPGSLLLDSLAILDRKLRLARRPRPRSMTFSRYLKSSAAAELQQRLECQEVELLSRLSDWAAYAPQSTPPTAMNADQLLPLCKKIVTSTRVPSPRSSGPRPRSKVISS